jgi:hypothetical protein
VVMSKTVLLMVDRCRHNLVKLQVFVFNLGNSMERERTHNDTIIRWVENDNDGDCRR